MLEKQHDAAKEGARSIPLKIAGEGHSFSRAAKTSQGTGFSPWGLKLGLHDT
jgi:hypothetical protein